MFRPEKYEEALGKVVEHPRKRNFFQQFAFEVMDEIRLSVNGGLLRKDIKDPPPYKGGRGALEHQVVVGLGCEALGELLGLPNYGKLTLRENGLTHDWDKRDEMLGETPDPDRRIVISKAKRKLVRLDAKLKFATGRGFLDVLESGGASWLQKLIFYVDDITELSNIVLLEDRIKSARERDAKKHKIETNDWDRELRLAKGVQKEIFIALQENGINIENESDVPIFILNRMKEKMDRMN